MSLFTLTDLLIGGEARPEAARPINDSSRRQSPPVWLVLAELSPAAANISNANYGPEPSSWKHTATHLGLTLFQRYPQLTAPVKSIARKATGHSPETEVPSQFEAVLRSYADSDLDSINTTAIQEILTGGEYSRGELYYLLTAVLYLELLESGTMRLSAEFRLRSFGKSAENKAVICYCVKFCLSVSSATKVEPSAVTIIYINKTPVATRDDIPNLHYLLSLP